MAAFDELSRALKEHRAIPGRAVGVHLELSAQILEGHARLVVDQPLHFRRSRSTHRAAIGHRRDKVIDSSRNHIDSTKNWEARTFPMTAELRRALEDQQAHAERLKRMIPRLVFTKN